MQIILFIHLLKALFKSGNETVFGSKHNPYIPHILIYFMNDSHCQREEHGFSDSPCVPLHLTDLIEYSYCNEEV